MTHDKKKKQDLGIFYTREEIVEFIYDILLLWKEREDREHKRWESHKPKHYPSVIDPACGEGIFLKKAVKKGFTTPQYIWGIDIDEHAKDKWEKINLLKSFKSKAKLDVHFFHQNGLLPLDEKKKLRYKKGGLKEFDAVVGNPPYGGIGIGNVNNELEQSLINFEVWKRSFRKDSAENSRQLMLVETKESNIRKSEKERLKSFPIEVLFIDRFIQLAKPGGWIAIIIPDGILSNSNLHYVRQYIADNAKVEAIVSLPRDAFKHVGTSAKTSILFLKKHSSSPPFQKGDSGGFNYPVSLASLEKMVPSPLAGEGQGEGWGLTEILSQYKEFYMKQTLSKDKKIYSNDFMMVRVDKTLNDMMEQKPFSRLDVNYYLPQWADVIEELKKGNVKVKCLKEFFRNNEWLIATDHVRASRGEHEGDNYPIEYYSPAWFYFTGYDIYNIPHCSQNAYERMKRSQVCQNDVLLGGFGMGPTGKSVLLSHKPASKAIVGNIFILRTGSNYNPFVLDTFFKSRFGQAQFNRYKTGVAFNSLSNDEIRYLIVPDFSNKTVTHIESEYKKMAAFHDKAMEAKAKGDEAGYKKNIETAEAMLKDLIARTEAVIKGEREDVI